MRIIHFWKSVVESAEEFNLKNCSVVIDGQNYFHCKYQLSRIPFTFGGDMDRYETHVHDNLMSIFKRANVKCYFVFKGGDTNINKKIKKFGRFAFDPNADKYQFLRPILLRDTSVQIVHDMGLEHAFCITESKDDCVALATRLGCPIISSDIEYCFKSAPYIPEPTLKFNSKTNTIECRRYTLQKFLKIHKLTKNKMVIFGVLSDSNIFPGNFFDNLLESWNVLDEEYHVKNQQLISWLSDHEEQEISRSITEYLTSEEDRSKFWEIHRCILRNMTNTEGGFATDYLINSQLDIGIKDPDWFEKGVVCKYVPSAYVNLFKWQVVQGSWFDREDNNNDNTDSLLLSIDIIRYAYNLLTNYKKSTLKVYHDNESYTEISTVDPCVPRPNYDCEVSVFENGWEEINGWNLFQYFLENKGINIGMLSNLPEDCVLLIISLVYYGRRKGDASTEARAIIMCYVLLNGHRLDNLVDTGLLAEDVREANRVTKNYFETRRFEAGQIYDGDKMKSFDMFQFCLQQINYLNRLCGSPYVETCYSRVYNGTFIYKMFTVLDRTSLPSDVFISQLLKRAPSVLTLINKLIKRYEALLIADA